MLQPSTLNLFIFSATMSGDVGLAISSILILNLNFQWGMRQSAELENIMTSVERIFEYGAIKPEAALEAGMLCVLFTVTVF
jgi:hypothetical protein